MGKNLSPNYSEGLLEFAKYAFAPNYFSYCGPNRNSDIKQAIVGSYNQDELRHLLNSFEAAVPYLNLIATSNHIKDIFDSRVVEAYWLGNNLLNRIPASNMYNHLENKVKKRSKGNWKEIVRQVGNRAKPHHSFHVFDIYRFAGLTKDGTKELEVIKMMNSCRISYGKVVAAKSEKRKATECHPEPQRGVFDSSEGSCGLSNSNRDTISIKTDKIKLVGGKLTLVASESEVEDTFGTAKAGDLVSIHWGMVCDKLSIREAKNLDFWTRYHLKLSNNLV